MTLQGTSSQQQRPWVWHCLAGALLALTGPAALSAEAPQPTGATAAAPSAKRLYFATPEAGVAALIAALRQDDVPALARVLGPGHQRIVDSGDAAADREARAKFVAEYDARHAIAIGPAAKAVLSIGASDWPMPIPLVKRPAGWTFDADAGAGELIARRIGRNELDAIQVCEAFVDMEREYAETDRDGDGRLEYTSRLVSTPGRQDGLYWPTQPGEPPSPAGPRLADASPQQVAARNAARPYHGYFYRVLLAQGPHAPGGARSYRVDGNLIGGVALIAWPASYLASGVKTFVCAMDGIVHERDFGPGTAGAVAKIDAYDPGPGWVRVRPASIAR